MMGAVDVAFDIAGYKARLDARPMSRSFAIQQVGIQSKALSDEASLFDLATPTDQVESVQRVSNLGQAVLNEISGDGDPLSDGTANDVEAWILLSLNAQNIEATQTAAATDQAKQTYEFVRDLPKNIGEWLGRAAMVPLDIAANGLWAALKAFLSDPVTIAVVAGGAGLYYVSRRRRAA